MTHGAGDYFCHYTDRAAAFDKIVPDRQLRLSPYDRVNDPLENQPWRFTASYFVDDSAPDPHEPEQRYFQFHREAEIIFRSARIAALTVDAIPAGEGRQGAAAAFAKGWGRARMWEQYAERHAGVCLLFDREKLTASIRSSLAAQGLAQPYERSVEYSNEELGARRHRLNLDSIDGKDVAVGARRFVEENHELLFFLKSEDWATEYEYRFVVTDPGQDYVRIDYGDALQAVVVGERFPEWQRPGAISRCREVGADALRVDWSMGAPILDTLRARPSQRGSRRPTTSEVDSLTR